MLNGTIDLHLHTTCSDGLETPEELTGNAVAQGYTAIAITDHDTTAGVDRAIETARGTQLEIVPGIELSAMDMDADIHILGYYVDYTNAEFLDRITFFMEKRLERAEKIVECLNYLGLDISIEAVLKIAHGAPVGRPHIAEALLSEKLIDRYNDAFIHYIGYKGPAYVPKYRISPREAIELIRDYGGVPVIAHPAAIQRDDIIPELVQYGLMGIEAVHPLHTPEKQEHYRRMAETYGVIATGGSDWHGRPRRVNINNLIESSVVPESVVRELKMLRNNNGNTAAENGQCGSVN